MEGGFSKIAITGRNPRFLILVIQPDLKLFLWDGF